ncbi:hypothetical protein CesoFtcFv8_015260 [Champsocephalus esox]|uniref:Uncharacterized protein n=1 Tax=Champsocephalus esox TaxID=159716 RepID=A0AAN8GV31_9TELE|nr:hypothetical protein CesoFtcFv8_015260 [Champsocephalus esox]
MHIQFVNNVSVGICAPPHLLSRALAERQYDLVEEEEEEGGGGGGGGGEEEEEEGGGGGRGVKASRLSLHYPAP